MNLHIIKYTYDTPTANIIFNNETLKKLSLSVGSGSRLSTHSHYSYSA